MAYNDDEEHVRPPEARGQPMLEFVGRVRSSGRNLRVDGGVSQRGPALSAKGLVSTIGRKNALPPETELRFKLVQDLQLRLAVTGR